MIIELLQKKDIDIYNRYVRGSGILFQTVEWIKSNDIDEYYIIIAKNWLNKIVISGLFTISKDKEENEKLLYCPRGPIVTNCNYRTFAKYMKYVIKIAKENECKMIRFDPFEEIDASSDIEKLLEDYKCEPSIYSRFWDYGWNLDLKSLTIEEYKSKLKEKTRYNINYAIKKNVKVICDNSENGIEKFYGLLCDTTKRDGFTIKPKACYSNLVNMLGNDIKVFLAYKDDELLSGAIALIIGTRAYYIYGASSNKNRNLQSTYLIQYAMIEWAFSRGCLKYDFGGIGYRLKDGFKINEGLLNFKRKFGGRLVKYMLSYKYYLD